MICHFCSKQLLVFLAGVSLVSAKVAPQDPLTDKEHFKGGEHDKNYDHEQFLGKDQAKEFDDLTPEQSKEKLAKLIPRIDIDKDGLVTEKELMMHINFMQKRYVSNDVDRTWKNYNAEAIVDGKLSWDSYTATIYGLTEDNRTKAVENPFSDGDEVDPDAEYTKMAERDRRRWKIADEDGDDKLNREEYTCFMHPEDCIRMQDLVVDETTEDIDKDKDGTISIEEYISDMYRASDYPELEGKEPDWVTSEREMFAETRDKNKDGKLDKEEMKNWIMPPGFDHADAEAHHLVHMADDDKDGKLSEAEILAHYDVFVGSQATDYGEQLQKHDPGEF